MCMQPVLDSERPIVKQCGMINRISEAATLVRRFVILDIAETERAARCIVQCREAHSPISSHLAEVIGEAANNPPGWQTIET